MLQESKATGGLVMVHAENGDAIDLLVHQALDAGRTEPKVHAETRPEIFEAEATSRAVRLAEYAGTPIYIVHVTCQGAAEEIIAGRARGVDAMGETCIQYLTLDVSDLSRPGLDGFEGARYVCSPPLRDPRNQPFLWDAISSDHLQVLSTDHCPFNDEQKALGLGDFSKIPNGLALIQHRVNLAVGARRPRGQAVRRAARSSCCRPRRRASSGSRTRARWSRARTPTSRSSTPSASTCSRATPR